MPFADLGEYKIYYKEFSQDKNQTIVFLHGFTLDHRMWLDDAPFFYDKYRVILVDMKGHGRSDAPESGYSRAHRVEDVIEFLDCLKLNQVHLAGLSYGGTTGLGVALHHPERLLSLSLLATSAAGYSAGPKISKIDNIMKNESLEKGKAKWIDTALMWYRDDKQEIRELMKTMMSEHSYTPWLDPKRGQYPREYDLDQVNRITTPTGIFVGEADRIFYPLAKQLHRLIPDSKLYSYPDVGHMVNLETPIKFRQDFLSFIGSAGQTFE